MNPLPERSNLDHLRKQAKDLLKLYRRGEAAAFERFRHSLPAARGKDDAGLVALGLRLHDAQSCVAREYGFASWDELKGHVEWQQLQSEAESKRRLHWSRLVYWPYTAGGHLAPRPRLAARLLAEHPELAGGDPHVACAIGDEAAVRAAIAADPAWVNRSGGPLNLPPLVAVTHSMLAQLDEYREPMRRCLQQLLDAGADPNQSIGERSWPHSLEQPGDHRLTAIYGAAGKLHDPVLTKVLLAAGADPNDNESLYHAVEDPDADLPCMRLLLQNGVRIKGTNAIGNMLQRDNLNGMRLLLEHAVRTNEGFSPSIIVDAIGSGRSAAHVRLLLEFGASPHVRNDEGESAYQVAVTIGATEVAALLAPLVNPEPLSDEDQFVAACARVDEAEARRIQARRPDLPQALPDHKLRQLPRFAMMGRDAAVRLMVGLGWPIAIAEDGDFNPTALHAAVFRGNAALTSFLLEHGASWREQHAFGDAADVLSWASLNRPPADSDWVGCADALVAHGMPGALLVDGIDRFPSPRVLLDGRQMHFSDEVSEFLLDLGAPSRS